MGRMSELCIDIENMFFVDGMDAESIAEELDVPLEMVKDYIADNTKDWIWDEDDGQPTESEEWRDFDPDC